MAMAMGTGGVRSDINVTPFIDIVLVLLIIFMVLTPMVMMAYESNVPPKAVADTSAVLQKEQLIITQLEPNTVFVNRDQVSVEQLYAKLKDILDHRKEKIVFVGADDKLNYGVVMKTMDIVRNAGAEKIGIITEKVEIPTE
jgi:biopolymer transport protein ExbD